MNQSNPTVLSPAPPVAAQDGLISIDMNFRITTWNDVMAQVTSVSAHACEGQPLFEAFPFLQEIGEAAYLTDALHGRSFSLADRPYKLSSDGQRLTFVADYGPCYDSAGHLIGAQLIIRDFSA